MSRQNANVLWVHNDGPIREVFAVATDGRFIARVSIPVPMDDVEDIAIGPGPKDGVDYVYLGDIGDNNKDRREVRLVRFAEPVLAAGPVAMTVAQAEAIRLKYPDGARDAETLMVDPVSGDVFIVPKRKKSETVLYRLAADRLSARGLHTLELVGELSFGEVSGGDMSPGGDFVVLRREDRGWLWSRRSGESVPIALQRRPRRVLARGVRQGGNGEAIGFRADGRGYYTLSEGEQEAIYFFPSPSVPFSTDD